MFLEKLELNGFKSFAHKTNLEFKPGITAIVGPNGVGKSNCLDSIRWVLGEQSIKLLRGKKSEDIIFSGSDKKSRLGMAEVALYLNDEEDKSKLGISEICISRKLYRNGESEYLINKQKTRLVDIQMLLAKVGVAHTSYAIIGQGMIDAFLLASAQERKEFFEEASGVKLLQIKRQQSLNKLEQTEENLEIAQIQLQEITPRLNSLTRQIKKLEHRTEIELQLKDCQQKYYSSLWHQIIKDWKIREDGLKKAVIQQENSLKQVNQFQNQMAKLTKDSLKSEKLEKLQNECQKLLEQKIQINQKIAKLQIQKIQDKSEQKQKNIPYYLIHQILKLLKLLRPLNNTIKQNIKNKNWQEVEKDFNQQQNLINKINKILEPFSTEGTPRFNDGIKEELAQNVDHYIKKLETQIKSIDEKIKEIQCEIKSENEKEKQERSHIWELQQKHQSGQEKLNQISGEVSNLRIELARLETKKDDLRLEIKQEPVDFDLVQMPGPDVSAMDGMNEYEKSQMVTEIGKLKHQLELIGGIDPEVQKEYEEIKKRHEFLSNQIEDLRKSIQSLEKLILELNKNIKQQFEKSFRIINDEFQKYFKILFGGGRAKLVLVMEEERDKRQGIREAVSLNENEFQNIKTNEEEPKIEKIKDRLKSTVYSGVDIEATPPGKKLKSINMLSGGERAMTSIALICAIISAHPSPFVILDEVDAALDEANSIRFAKILKKLCQKSQFIIITHNRATMEKADILYGVTMEEDGVSKLLSLKLESAEKYTNR